jgi:hypothetical protein
LALTVQTDQQAGQIAAAITTLNQVVADLQGAIAEGVQIMSMQTTLVGSGTVMQTQITFSAQDTASVFNAILTVAQNNLSALNAQLASM